MFFSRKDSFAKRALMTAIAMPFIAPSYAFFWNIIGEGILLLPRILVPAYVVPTLPLQIALPLVANFVLTKIIEQGIKDEQIERQTAANAAQQEMRVLQSERAADIARLHRISDMYGQGIPTDIEDDLFYERSELLRNKLIDLQMKIAGPQERDLEKEYVHSALSGAPVQIGMAASLGLAAIYKPDLLFKPMSNYLPGRNYLTAAAGGLAGHFVGWMLTSYNFKHSETTPATQPAPAVNAGSNVRARLAS